MSQLSVPTRAKRVVIGLALMLLASGAVAEFGARWAGILVGVTLVGLLAAWLVSGRSSSNRTHPSESETNDSDGDGTGSEGNSVWNAIPSRQYTGRHVESGGLARDEQKKALTEIQEEAKKQDPEEFRD